MRELRRQVIAGSMHFDTAQLSGLMQRVAAGDRAAFAQMYAQTSAKLYGVLLRILKRRDLADEALQDTYVRIWKHAGRFDPSRASPITWMVAIARNRALDEIRKAAPVSFDGLEDALEVADPEVLVSEKLVAAVDMARLKACLDGLEPERREMIVLAYLEGASREDLGRRYNRPAGTIKTWLHRSLKQLKVCLST